MSVSRRSPAFAAVLVALGVVVMGLDGCVSILPKQPPVQLYQFGHVPAPPAAAAPHGAGGLGVVLSQVTLPRAAMGDGILTLRGDEAAYVAGARWLTPAVLMLQEDVQQAFEVQAAHVRLIDRSQLGAAAALLRLDGLEFDARYDPAALSAPVVVVSVRATLTRTDGGGLQQQVFTVRSPAAENRVGPIVAAFDTAVGGVTSQVIAWTDAQVPALAVPPSTTSIPTADP